MEQIGSLGRMTCAQDLRFAPQRCDCVAGFVGTGLGSTVVPLLARHDPDAGA